MVQEQAVERVQGRCHFFQKVHLFEKLAFRIIPIKIRELPGSFEPLDGPKKTVQGQEIFVVLDPQKELELVHQLALAQGGAGFVELVGLSGANHPLFAVSRENQHHAFAQIQLSGTIVGELERAAAIFDEKPQPGQELIAQGPTFVHGLRRAERNHGRQSILLAPVQGHLVERPVDVVEREGIDPEVLFEVRQESIDHLGAGSPQQQPTPGRVPDHLTTCGFGHHPVHQPVLHVFLNLLSLLPGRPLAVVLSAIFVHAAPEVLFFDDRRDRPLVETELERQVFTLVVRSAVEIRIKEIIPGNEPYCLLLAHVKLLEASRSQPFIDKAPEIVTHHLRHKESDKSSRSRLNTHKPSPSHDFT